eukprot:m51a1_g9276 hypothetical protein (432) ;mRNA; f:102673-104750
MGSYDFDAMFEEVKAAIASGVDPQRIPQGSSGSYFVFDSAGTKVSVFKPRSEEPYAPLNPKWTKWFQRRLMPCCFGRDPLILNQGYLSEAGASLVDMWLGLSVVPETRVVRLGSKSFHYGPLRQLVPTRDIDDLDGDSPQAYAFSLLECCGGTMPERYPAKCGSMQRFRFETLPGEHQQSGSNAPKQLPQRALDDFRDQFERLVVLDYVIRNTDRGHDNWLVTYDESAAEAPSSAPASSPALVTPRGSCPSPEPSPDAPAPSRMVKNELAEREAARGPEEHKVVHLWAIDNGLAFPYKHPDHWRSYPYAWAWLPHAKVPFSESTRALVRRAFADDRETEALVAGLHNLFAEHEGTNFSEAKFRGQMRVMRGQIANLRAAIADPRSSPATLVAMQPCYVDARIAAYGEGDSLVYNVWRRVTEVTTGAWFSSC